MALKDWEKQRDLKHLTTWTNQTPGKRDELVEIQKTESGWKMIKIIGNEVTIDEDFKTKPQAMNRAMAYMRSH